MFTGLSVGTAGTFKARVLWPEGCTDCSFQIISKEKPDQKDLFKVTGEIPGGVEGSAELAAGDYRITVVR